MSAGQPGRSVGAGRVFDAVNVLALAGIAFLSLYPFAYVILLSFAGPADVARGGVLVWPRAFSLAAYEMVLADPGFRAGFVNSIVRTLLGTATTLLLTCLAAYPLSRPRMPWRKQMVFFVLFTMLFSGGLVPRYLVVKTLGLVDTRWALVLPIALTAFNVFVLKSFFERLPPSLEEAARLDGAGDLTILFRIFVPLSRPALATIALWTAVGHWNHWFDALLFITSEHKQVLQIFLQRIVIENSIKDIQFGVSDMHAANFSGEALKGATVVLAVLPLLALYPFVQRHFAKGITLGGVKE